MAKVVSPVLARMARMSRRQIAALTLSAVLNGLVNGAIVASLGRWFTYRYSTYQTHQQSVGELTELIYGRRNRGGMLASSLRRNADIEEVKFRKRAYDEAYNEFNTKVMKNILTMRQIVGGVKQTSFERHFQDELTATFADIDRCLTKAYDSRLMGQQPLPVLEACHMADMYQYVLDCGATLSNELHKQIEPVSLSLWNFGEADKVRAEAVGIAEANMIKACKPPAKAPPPIAASLPQAPQAPPVAATPPVPDKEASSAVPSIGEPLVAPLDTPQTAPR